MQKRDTGSTTSYTAVKFTRCVKSTFPLSTCSLWAIPYYCTTVPNLVVKLESYPCKAESGSPIRPHSVPGMPSTCRQQETAAALQRFTAAEELCVVSHTGRLKASCGQHTIKSPNTADQKVPALHIKERGLSQRGAWVLFNPSSAHRQIPTSESLTQVFHHPHAVRRTCCTTRVSHETRSAFPQ